MIRVVCRTRFDITATGVKSNFNRNRIPFTDSSGTVIDDHSKWLRSRNKQRNWETVNQIIALRTLPVDISDPRLTIDQSGKFWTFDFAVEQPSEISLDLDPVGSLKIDCQGVPMITGLDEDPHTESMLMSDINIYFNAHAT